ncbi:EamA family transporter [Candidatus Woesearchaeota archaeon]|nr:EamA family transporter [Candidatus Woesearchaeota archaeon]
MILPSFLMVLLATLFGALASFFFKTGADRLRGDLKSVYTNYRLFLGMVLYVFGAFSFIYGLRLGAPLSVLYPMVSLTYIWTTIISHKFLKEKITRSTLIGIGCIIAGVGLIGLGM